MRISELSPDLRPTTTTADSSSSSFSIDLLLSDLESCIKSLESLTSTSPSALSQTLIPNLRTTISRLSSSPPFADPAKLRIWKLSFRLWNAAVDLSNTHQTHHHQNQEPGHDQDKYLADLRLISANLLLLAGNPAGVPNPELKTASFFYKTGLILHDLGNYDLASTCFVKATDVVSSVKIDLAGNHEEKNLVLDLNLARARTAWEVADKNLAVTFLNRSKNLILGSPYAYRTLAEQFLQFGKVEISSNGKDASKLLAEALDLCEKGILTSRNVTLTLELEALKVKCLRFLAAERLGEEDFDGVLNCVKVLRGVKREEIEHSGVGYMAMKAWLGLGRVAEAEKELKGMMANKEVPENVIVSAAELYLLAGGVEVARSVLMGMVGRCRAGAGAALRVVRRVVEGNGGGRAKVVAEMVADEKVVGLFKGASAAKERSAMHGILWNCGAEHFRSKEYGIGAEMFEKSMLYVPHDEDSRNRRSNCFRVLSLCYLALNQLDRAQEYIDQADKLEPNIRSTFLKFKIHLLKKDEKEAVNQIKAMVGCIDFDPEYLTLSTHEAIASQCLAVAISSLSMLLNLYSPSGKKMPMPEVAVLRNLITLLHHNSNSQDEDEDILKYTRHAHTKMIELGVKSFFGEGAAGSREINWFAGSSWNMGLKMGKKKKFESCAEFLELASEFCSETNGNESVDESRLLLCKSLIISVGAMISAEEQTKVPMQDANVRKAMGMLSRAGKLLPSIQSDSDREAEFSSLLFQHTYNTYHLLNRIDGTLPQQLQLVKSFTTSAACSPKRLFQLGAIASSQGSNSSRHMNPETAEFALNACLSALLASPSPDYDIVSCVLRRLVRLATLSGNKDDDDGGPSTFGVYRQAYQIIVGLKEGEYPSEEGKWLAITAWNRGGMAVRLRQVEVARKWMKMGLDLAHHVAGMDKYIGGMEECFASF